MHKTCKFTQYSIIFSVPDKNDHIGGHFILNNLQIKSHSIVRLVIILFKIMNNCYNFAV